MELTGADDRSSAIQKLVKLIGTLAEQRGYRAGVTAPPYDPRAYARLLGALDIIEVVDMPVAGAIVIRREGPVICLNPTLGTRTQQRFTLAHEVAHLAIWYAQKQLLTSYRPRSARGKFTDRFCHEIAAELLVPQEEVRRGWRGLSINGGVRGRKLHFIEEIARLYDVSLQMAAVRFREICAPNTGIGMLQGQTRRFLWSIGIQSQAQLLSELLIVLTATKEAENTAEPYGFQTYYSNRDGLRTIPFSWHRLQGENYLVVAEG